MCNKLNSIKVSLHDLIKAHIAKKENYKGITIEEIEFLQIKNQIDSQILSTMKKNLEVAK